MQNFQGKTAFVTGAASGIGYALVEAFLAEGMNVVLADVEQAALDKAMAKLSAHDNRIRAVQCDVSSRPAVKAAAEEAIGAFGKVHVLCNNAGVGGGGPLEQVAPAQWDWVLGVNLHGVIHGIEAFLPHMKAHGEEGHIVNTASMAGMMTFGLMGPYSASKYAVVALTETLAGELAETKLGASVLCPGWVRTKIGMSGRNAPAEVAAAAKPPPEGSPMAARRAEVAELLQNGMDPAEVAARVLAAMRADDLYIFTASAMRPTLEARFAAINACYDKAEAFVWPPKPQ